MKRVIISLTVLALSACGTQGEVQSRAGAGGADYADVLYSNGVIWTGADRPDAAVLALKDGVISYVGDGRNVRIAANKVIDLQGRFLMPGFIDNHVHFFEGGAALASVNLRDAATPQIFAQRIADFTATVPQGQWVLNGNWDHELWGGELPHRKWIDEVTGDTPVFVIRLDGHMALANSAALQRAGISASTVAPEGGEIVFDETGEPSGILKGNALNLVLSVIPQPSEQEILNNFDAAQSHALSLGLTQVHAVTANPTETTMLDAFRLVNARGEMKVRVHVSMPIEHWQSTRDVIAESGRFSGRLHWGGIKGFVDGSLGATTAWFYEPYEDTPTSGAALTEPGQLNMLMNDADAAGLNLSIHAIGDLAIDNLIASLRDIAGDRIKERRYRIEHFQHPSSAAIEAIAQSGIVASMQPWHAIDDGRWAEQRIGAERIKTTYAFRTILDAGAILTFGSDWPVAPLSPLEGVYAAVTRRTTDGANPDGWLPEQKITVEEALSAYTAANAYAEFEEQHAGTLEAGKRADFVVLSDDPRAVDPVKIRDIRVLATVIGGITEYEAE